MRNSTSMSPWLYLPIYSWRTNRDRACQLLARHCPSRYILCSSPLPLRSLYGCRLCHCCRFRPLIPPIYRLHASQHMNKNPLWSNVRRCKPHILPTTLPRISWYASAILRLSRRLHPMKYSFLYWIPCLTCCCDYVPIYYLRSIYSQTRSTFSRTHRYNVE